MFKLLKKPSQIYKTIIHDSWVKKIKINNEYLKNKEITW